MTVFDLKKGKSGTILRINFDCLPIKLLEIGCLPGSRIYLEEIAPLGDPVLVKVNDTYLAVGKEVAQNIDIETDEE